MRFLGSLLILGLALQVTADLYMHNPRGSNDRLNEQAAERDDADRLFDSQNNNRGGYNVGDRTDEPFDENNAALTSPTTLYNYNDITTAQQYSMMYYEGSILSVEWTNQHGCGGNEATDPYTLNCNILLQYMCDEDETSDTTRALGVWMHDGQNTNQRTEPNSFADTDPNEDQTAAEGVHESSGWYYECKMTDRNYGLFHADQDLNGDDCRYTRQNPNGGRRGLECPEERDYYPYWRPSPWKDVAYMTDHTEFCDYIQANTMNTNDKWKCMGAVETNQQAPITMDECTASGWTWKAFSHDLAAGPECIQVGWSRVNHLGNSRNAQPLTYNWTLPTFAGDLSGVKTYETNWAKCVARLRYNISTDDYDPWNTFSDQDDDPNNGVQSPVTENPTIDVGADLRGLQLAINTAQFGRTFQDRSHVFYIMRRPTAGPIASMPAAASIWNLNVRGKRGNIVQTYPAVEYDYVPNRLHVTGDDVIHIQWTGSNTHDNGNPGGDGQTGDAGEGTGGTDRHNFVQLDHMDQNYPIPYDVDKYIDTNILATAGTCYDLYGATIGDNLPTADENWVDCAVWLSTSGQFRTANSDFTNFQTTLDTAPASLIGGVVFQVDTAGSYNYMCTRNNNFSNRSQKGTLVVDPDN